MILHVNLQTIQLEKIVKDKLHRVQINTSFNL